MIQSFWYGSELTPLEQLCMASFVRQGRGFELYTYDESLSVPDGVTLRDASEIYPEEEVFEYRSGLGEGSVAVFADFFRYKLLYERGGWWVDTDIFYTGGEIPDKDMFFARDHDSTINVAAMRFPKGSPIIEECVRRCRSIGKENASKYWGLTGPELLTGVLEEVGQMDEAFPKEYAYPISWKNAQTFYLPEQEETIRKKVGDHPFLHLWNEILRRTGIHKFVRPPEGSYLDKRAEDLNFDWPYPEMQYSAETVRQMIKNREKARLQSTLTWRVVSRLHPILSRLKSGLFQAWS